jgi:hypothetical protein
MKVELIGFIESTGLVSDMDRAVLINDTERATCTHRTVSIYDTAF